MNGLHSIPRERGNRLPAYVNTVLERGLRSFLVQNAPAEVRIYHGEQYRAEYRWRNTENFRSIPEDSLVSWQLNHYYCGDDTPMPWDRLEILNGEQ